jgi:hypothetical protein
MALFQTSILKTQIEQTNKEIDTMVYNKSYDFTKDEIRIVEGI